jgi:hypothetical protein
MHISESGSLFKGLLIIVAHNNSEEMYSKISLRDRLQEPILQRIFGVNLFFLFFVSYTITFQWKKCFAVGKRPGFQKTYVNPLPTNKICFPAKLSSQKYLDPFPGMEVA